MAPISKEVTSTRRRKAFRLFLWFAVAILLLVFCYRYLLSTQPPDLSGCTRIEIRYPGPTVNYFFLSRELQSVLDPKEREYIESLAFFTVDDQARINAFAQEISSGSFDRFLMWGTQIVGVPELPEVICYRGSRRTISFEVYGDCIITRHRMIFDYPRGKPNMEIIQPPGIQPFKLRYECALNMNRICASGALYRKKVTLYPQSTEWCDAVMRERTNALYVKEEQMRGWFKCPAAGEGDSHYALNSNCKPDSPPDMVLLFETKAGWNQHGGPELFTFDNHDPKGGCVLLNDGTVKFIRTKEELQQLRWR